MLRLIGPLALAAGFAQAALAAGVEGTYAMRGLGGAACGKLTEALAGANAAQVREGLGIWISGYISARNEIEPSTFDLIPLQDPRILVALVEGACRQNPDAAVQVAVSALAARLAGGRAEHDTPILQLGPPEAPVFLRASVLALAQAQLQALGLMAAPAAPGSFDDATAAALSAFQTSSGLQATGLPDDATLVVLLGQK